MRKLLTLTIRMFIVGQGGIIVREMDTQMGMLTPIGLIQERAAMSEDIVGT